MPSVSTKLQALSKTLSHTQLEVQLKFVCQRLMLDEQEIICWIKFLDFMDLANCNFSPLDQIFYVGIWTKSRLGLDSGLKTRNLIERYNETKDSEFKRKWWEWLNANNASLLTENEGDRKNHKIFLEL